MLTYSTPRRIKLRRKAKTKTAKFYSRVYDTETKKRFWRSTGKTSIKAARAQVKAWAGS